VIGDHRPLTPPGVVMVVVMIIVIVMIGMGMIVGGFVPLIYPAVSPKTSR
jgi:Na+-transporting methylmalonyl-CoA/oxaloacetate decarboxylase gamma subunit